MAGKQRIRKRASHLHQKAGSEVSSGHSEIGELVKRVKRRQEHTGQELSPRLAESGGRPALLHSTW